MSSAQRSRGSEPCSCTHKEDNAVVFGCGRVVVGERGVAEQTCTATRLKACTHEAEG